MAIENVMMMNVVGKINYVDRFAKDIFLFNDIQIVDAMNEIDTGRLLCQSAKKTSVSCWDLPSSFLARTWWMRRFLCRRCKN